MAFDWKEFLALARDVSGRAGTGYSAEASDRTAVGRAYYAAFCHVRDCAKSKLGFSPTGQAEDHRKLRKHLVIRGKLQVASHLNRLRQWRNQCDYDDQVQNASEMAKGAIRMAANVIQECK